MRAKYQLFYHSGYFIGCLPSGWRVYTVLQGKRSLARGIVIRQTQGPARGLPYTWSTMKEAENFIDNVLIPQRTTHHS